MGIYIYILFDLWNIQLFDCIFGLDNFDVCGNATSHLRTSHCFRSVWWALESWRKIISQVPKIPIFSLMGATYLFVMCWWLSLKLRLGGAVVDLGGIWLGIPLLRRKFTGFECLTMASSETTYSARCFPCVCCMSTIVLASGNTIVAQNSLSKHQRGVQDCSLGVK